MAGLSPRKYFFKTHSQAKTHRALWRRLNIDNGQAKINI
jgi:hypothetical protein